MKASAGAGGHAGAQFVPDRSCQLEHRTSLGGGAQVVLVGQPLLVEGQHIGHDGPGVEQRNGRVVGCARREPGQWPGARVGLVGNGVDRQAREHPAQEARVGADAVGERGQTGPVE